MQENTANLLYTAIGLFSQRYASFSFDIVTDVSLSEVINSMTLVVADNLSIVSSQYWELVPSDAENHQIYLTSYPSVIQDMIVNGSDFPRMHGISNSGTLSNYMWYLLLLGQKIIILFPSELYCKLDNFGDESAINSIINGPSVNLMLTKVDMSESELPVILAVGGEEIDPEWILSLFRDRGLQYSMIVYSNLNPTPFGDLIIDRPEVDIVKIYSGIKTVLTPFENWIKGQPLLVALPLASYMGTRTITYCLVIVVAIAISVILANPDGPMLT